MGIFGQAISKVIDGGHSILLAKKLFIAILHANTIDSDLNVAILNTKK